MTTPTQDALREAPQMSDYYGPHGLDVIRFWIAYEMWLAEFCDREAAPQHSDEFMSVSITRDGVVTSHNAYDANFDEMVEATQKIIAALTERYNNRLKCPFAAGKALREGWTDASHG